MSEINQMRSTGWLAQRLGLSVTTIERLRAQGSPDLPPCRTIGKSKRYDEQVVEQWIRDAGCANPAQPAQATGAGKPSTTLMLSARKGAPNGNA